MELSLALLLVGAVWSATTSLFAQATHQPQIKGFYWTIDGAGLVWALVIVQFVGLLMMVVGGVWVLVGGVV